MKFKQFLRKKLVVFTFGRMNPFTYGHYHLAQVLVKTLTKFSTIHNARIYLSHTQNSTKDPLSYNDKIKYTQDALREYDQIQVTKSQARTIIEVAKELESEGFTDIVLVVGSDRVREFKTLLEKYNGKDYKFNSITVVSAGARDPDADDVTGMSASKVRALAVKGDFEGFKKGVPYPPKKSEELYNKIRKIMKVQEDINFQFEELLTEGVHDKGIFKAVFLAGGPGSGKDYVLDNTLQGHGLTEINSDKALEFLMDKEGLDKTMPEDEKELRGFVRSKAKNMTELKQRLALQGRNGLIINGTGDDLEKITRIKTSLESLGYDTSMIMVNTDDEVSAQRNIERGQRGGRTVPETIRKQKWDAAQDARTEFAKMFGDRYMEFDNSEDLRTADPDTVKQKKLELMQLYKNVQQFVAQPPQSEESQEWVANEMQKKDNLDIPEDGAEKIAPHDSNASQEAKKLGLQYYGFGRYGRNGKVTHRSIHDKLVAVQDNEEKPKENKKENDLGAKDEKFNKIFSEEITIDEELQELFSEDLRKWFDKDHPEGGWKRINSKGEAIGPCAREPGEPKPKCMSNEKRASLSKKERAAAVAVKRKHDPNPERKGKPINVSNFGKGKLSESYQLSDSGALNLLLLGNSVDEHEFKKFEEQKEEKLLKDKSGRVRVFMLRAAAAREAHTIDGTVLKYKNGYVIKLKEEIEDVEIYQGTIRNWITENREQTPIRNTSESTGGEERKLLSETTTQECTFSNEETSTETPARPKISLAEIRQRKTQKETTTTGTTRQCESTQINEIDRGIEPGISMAGAGESIGRDMGEKIKKRSHKVSVTELTGDETTASISAQKEDELKKVGISLNRFKSKRPIG